MLRYLPFELLPMPESSRLLMDLTILSYLPSGSTLPELQGADEPAPGTVALANPTLRPGDQGLRPANLLAARFGLDELPAAEEEVASLERWLSGPSRLLAGTEATEAAFRSATVGGASVVHLATHAVIDERPGRGAAVLLAPEGDDDGLLYPSEIARLDLPTNLTVLAACQTALGLESNGNALTTLTGAFIAAGSRSVVATLWQVGDRATAEFMDQFYWHLGHGATPAQALRRTKQRFRDSPDWQAPHLWAGYVLTGTAPALETPSNRILWLGLGSVSFLLFLLLLARRRTTG